MDLQQFLLLVYLSVKLFHIQFVDGDKYRQLAEDKTLKYSTVNPQRGNIYSFDGSLLAIDNNVWCLFWFKNCEKLFDSEVYNLSKKIAELKSVDQNIVHNSLISARNSGNRYYSIIKNIGKEDVDRIKSFPILNMDL